MKKFFFDSFPVILFFTTYYYFHNIYLSTKVLVIISSINLILLYFIDQSTVNVMRLVSTVAIVFFGGATIFLKNDVFLKLKPTIFYWILSIILFITPVFSKKHILKEIMLNQFVLNDAIWWKLHFSWAVFFTAIGLVNVYIAFFGYFTEKTWVYFKVFGINGFTMLFLIIQFFYVQKHLNNSTKEEPN